MYRLCVDGGGFSLGQEPRCNDVDHVQTRPLVGLFEGKMPLWNLTRHD